MEDESKRRDAARASVARLMLPSADTSFGTSASACTLAFTAQRTCSIISHQIRDSYVLRRRRCDRERAVGSSLRQREAADAHSALTKTPETPDTAATITSPSPGRGADPSV